MRFLAMGSGGSEQKVGGLIPAPPICQCYSFSTRSELALMWFVYCNTFWTAQRIAFGQNNSKPENLVPWETQKMFSVGVPLAGKEAEHSNEEHMEEGK